MPHPHFPHSGRRKYYWKLRANGYRELMTKHRWGFRGAYAEKSIRGRSVMQTIVKKTDDYYLCCFQLKDDFWSTSTADGRRKEAEQRRRSFRVVGRDEAAPRQPLASDSDPRKLDPDADLDELLM